MIASMTNTAERLDREKSFHDGRFEDDSAREATGVFYTAVPAATEQYIARVERAAHGDVLEFGCGAGALGVDLSIARSLTAIDISPVAIREAEKSAMDRGIESQFYEMNAEALSFGADTFDLVYGSGILHHLDLHAACSQLRSAVRPGGRAIFLEPLGHNPLINWYRDRTPEMRTEDEHPLRSRDLAMISRYCNELDTAFHGLASLGSAPVLDRRGGTQINKILTALDGVLLRVPKVQLLSWIVILEMRF
ncbi:MAG: SAM-dependent methyltransferase [Verrucomicrobiales bacterium]|jgi:SAM-dependent methyltransferase